MSGPPPQPPMQTNRTQETQETISPRIPKSPSGGNNSFLHNSTNSRPTTNFGKPNLAPKPPGASIGLGTSNSKPATPPKKIVINGRVPVTRAQSMRVPRSPPVTPQAYNGENSKDFSSLNSTQGSFHQSQENLMSTTKGHTRNQTLPSIQLNKQVAPQPPTVRPSGPPPGRPNVPLPPSRTGSNVNLKAPLSPPPPPPTVGGPNLAPQFGAGTNLTPTFGNGAPPPPPHRTIPPPTPQHTRMPPQIPQGPPPPPIRNSSMRNGNNINIMDFENRFANLFHPISDFPRPPKYQGFVKVYSSRQILSNKQQAPLPPSIQLGTKLWDSSTC